MQYSASNIFPHFVMVIRVVVARAGAGCARPMKGGVWPSLPANVSVKKDTWGTGASIDRAHLKNWVQ